MSKDQQQNQRITRHDLAVIAISAAIAEQLKFVPSLIMGDGGILNQSKALTAWKRASHTLAELLFAEDEK